MERRTLKRAVYINRLHISLCTFPFRFSVETGRGDEWEEGTTIIACFDPILFAWKAKGKGKDFCFYSCISNTIFNVQDSSSYSSESVFQLHIAVHLVGETTFIYCGYNSTCIYMSRRNGLGKVLSKAEEVSTSSVWDCHCVTEGRASQSECVVSRCIFVFTQKIGGRDTFNLKNERNKRKWLGCHWRCFHLPLQLLA